MGTFFSFATVLSILKHQLSMRASDQMLQADHSQERDGQEQQQQVNTAARDVARKTALYSESYAIFRATFVFVCLCFCGGCLHFTCCVLCSHSMSLPACCLLLACLLLFSLSEPKYAEPTEKEAQSK